MKIAIIGATGMIGHHTALAVLAAGHQLRVVHRPGAKLDQISDLDYDALSADLNDLASLSAALVGVDAAINCAGYYPTLPKPWYTEVAIATQQMNNFYRACQQAKLQKIVYLGAAIALKQHPQDQPAHADLTYASQPSNYNPYLQVKWAMDQQAMQKAKEGLPVVIASPSMNFGEFDYAPTTGQLITGIANETLPGIVRGKRNVIYAGDAGRGLLLACEKGQKGERYLLTGTNITMEDLVAKIARLCSVKPPKTIPLAVAKLVSGIQSAKYRFMGGPAPTVSATAIAVMSAGQFLDGSKAEQALGFKASVSVDEAIKRSLAWFRKVGYVASS